MSNKELLLMLLISTFFLVFVAYIIFNLCDPIFIEEDTVILTPKMLDLLNLLEDQYK